MYVRFLVAEGDVKQAESACTAFHNRFPRDPAAVYAVASLQALLGRLQDSFASLRRIAEVGDATAEYQPVDSSGRAFGKAHLAENYDPVAVRLLVLATRDRVFDGLRSLKEMWKQVEKLAEHLAKVWVSYC